MSSKLSIRFFTSFFGFLLIILFLFNCEAEKLITSNLGTSSASDSTLLIGRITRMDNDHSVEFARLQLSFHVAFTDSNGRYRLPIIYKEEYNRNLDPVLVITAPNFETYIENVRVLPVPSTINIVLTWAPPVIHKRALIVMVDNPEFLDGPKYVQAIIKDYQGIETVKEVKAVFSKDEKPFIWPMYLVRTTDEFTGYYESPVLHEPIYVSKDKIYYSISTLDNDGNYWEEVDISFLERPDEPIF